MMEPSAIVAAPKRTVHCRDAISWLQGQAQLDSTITSMPDVSEIKGMSLETWRKWFSDAALLIFTKLKPGAFAIFYQTDIKVITEHNAYFYIDKAFMIQLVANSIPGIRMLWRKIITASEKREYVTRNKSPFSHLMCFRKDLDGNLSDPDDRIPDISMMGEKLWTRDVATFSSEDFSASIGMGFNATVQAVRFLQSAGCKEVCDPFCGKGSVLAVANWVGLDATGVEISTNRARKAEALQVSEEVGFSARAWLAGKESSQQKKKDRKAKEGAMVFHETDPELNALFPPSSDP